MNNLLVSPNLKEKIEWYIHAHGHSSIGGLNLLWTYFHFNDKDEVANKIEEVIEEFRRFSKSNQYENDIKSLYEKTNIIEKQIKFQNIDISKKTELQKVISGVKTNISRLQNVIEDPNYEEKIKLSKILLTVSNELINRYPKLLFGDLVGKDKPINGVNVEIIHKDPVDEKEILCEGYEMQLLFFNLISNAIESIIGNGAEAAGFGKIWIKMNYLPTSVKIDIADDGEILSPENIQKIKTHMFFTTKGRQHGSGMKIIYDIVDKYKASMEIKSDPKIPLTTFSLTIPYRK